MVTHSIVYLKWIIPEEGWFGQLKYTTLRCIRSCFSTQCSLKEEIVDQITNLIQRIPKGKLSTVAYLDLTFLTHRENCKSFIYFCEMIRCLLHQEENETTCPRALWQRAQKFQHNFTYFSIFHSSFDAHEQVVVFCSLQHGIPRYTF